MSYRNITVLTAWLGILSEQEKGLQEREARTDLSLKECLRHLDLLLLGLPFTSDLFNISTNIDIFRYVSLFCHFQIYINYILICTRNTLASKCQTLLIPKLTLLSSESCFCRFFRDSLSSLEPWKHFLNICLLWSVLFGWYFGWQSSGILQQTLKRISLSII